MHRRRLPVASDRSTALVTPRMKLYKEWVCPECAETVEHHKGQRAPRCPNVKWHNAPEDPQVSHPVGCKCVECGYGF
jgi:hypothetical protein